MEGAEPVEGGEPMEGGEPARSEPFIFSTMAQLELAARLQQCVPLRSEARWLEAQVASLQEAIGRPLPHETAEVLLRRHGFRIADLLHLLEHVALPELRALRVAKRQKRSLVRPLDRARAGPARMVCGVEWGGSGALRPRPARDTPPLDHPA